MTEGRLELGGVQLRYVDDGAGDRPLLLLHSGAASLEGWSAVLPALARATRVVAIDRPGWGRSTRPSSRPSKGVGPSPFGPVGEAAIVAALVERLGLAKPILVGSSAGGTVALLTGLERPALFGGLVLLSPGVYSGLGTGLAPGWMVPLMSSRLGRAMGHRLVGNGFRKTFAKTMRKMFHDPSRVTPDFLARRGQEIGIDDVGSTLWETAIAARSLGLAARVPDCRLPTLVVAGATDRFVPVAENERLARDIHDSRLELVPACGHLPHEERPDHFIGLVLAFRANHISPP